MRSVLYETQEERDMELSVLMNMSMDDIRKLGIAKPESIRIFDGQDKPMYEGDYVALYQDYKYLNYPAYLRTLMRTSITARHPDLKRLLKETKGKVCLDYGSGVGTHAIALLENWNDVSILDVEGSLLLEFAAKRIVKRGFLGCRWYSHKDNLPDEEFDLIICTDVLEHIFDPVGVLQKITRALKQGGILHLQVSSMVKDSSGHFEQSIKKWRVEGPDYLRANYRQKGQTLFIKK